MPDPEAKREAALRDAEHLRARGRELRKLEAALADARALWAAPADALLGNADRGLARHLFGQVLDHVVVLEAVARRHARFFEAELAYDAEAHVRGFAIAHAAHNRQLALALALVDRTAGRPQLTTLLDEKSERDGTPAGSYARVRDFALHPASALRTFAARQLDKLFALGPYELVRGEPAMDFVVDEVSGAYREAKKLLCSRGAGIVAGGALDALRDAGERAFFPAQVELARFLGKTRVHREGGSLVAPAQIVRAVAKLRPGDVLVERRNWYLSNVGLPGFWPHAALWLGAPADLAARFDGDAETTRRLGGKLTEVLRARHPAAWAAYVAPAPDGAHRIVEAVAEGVAFQSAERSLACDYAAAMRPKLPTHAVAHAIARAFDAHGLPYDFDFDLASDRALFCSELVVRAYEGALALPTERVLGRATVAPNALVAHFDATRGTAAEQLEFVFFLDGSEALGRADWKGEGEFRASHRRSKWDFAQG